MNEGNDWDIFGIAVSGPTKRRKFELFTLSYGVLDGLSLPFIPNLKLDSQLCSQMPKIPIFGYEISN